MNTISVNGAKGGQGTSTVACAVAIFAAGHARTTLVTDDFGATAALLGLARTPTPGEPVEVIPRLTLATEPDESTELAVFDAGRVQDAPERPANGARYTVVRGPCYLALAAVLSRPGPLPDGIILVAEPKRALSARDVTEVLDVPVVATVEATPDVARTIDAGLLACRLHRLPQLHPLLSLITPLLPHPPSPTLTPSPHPPPPTPSPTPSRQSPLPPSRPGTDLPCPLDTAFGRGRARVNSRRESGPAMHLVTVWTRYAGPGGALCRGRDYADEPSGTKRASSSAMPASRDRRHNSAPP